MMRRDCPECETQNYSSSSGAEFWRCCNCGMKICIEHQKFPDDNKEEVNSDNC